METEKGKLLDLPGGRVIDFPFLKQAVADKMFINTEGETTAFLFNTPQKIEAEEIKYDPKRLGVLIGDILAWQIAFDVEKQLYFIHLSRPLELKTRVLGSINLGILGVDPEGNLEAFVTEEMLKKNAS